MTTTKRKRVCRMTKEEMAYIYCGLLFDKEFNFSLFNKKIIQYWSFSALKEIKNKAWKTAKRLQEWERGLPELNELPTKKGKR